MYIFILSLLQGSGQVLGGLCSHLNHLLAWHMAHFDIGHFLLYFFHQMYTQGNLGIPLDLFWSF